MDKKIQILMSTYNGEKYLKEQLDSIINQTYKNFCLLIRDDGSQDSTISIINEYKKIYNFIDVSYGKNLGVVESFFELVKIADMSCDYFAFSDQDDVWLPKKLEAAIKMISVHDDNIPLLYFSKLTLVDKNLNFLCYNPIPVNIGIQNALVQNIVTGCSMVVNKKLFALCREKIPNPKNIAMHDRWFYLLSSCFGVSIYDSDSFILYRQHGNNSLGMPKSFFEKMFSKLNYIKDNNGRNLRIRQMEEFFSLYNDNLSCDKKYFFEKFLILKNGFFTRLYVAFTVPFTLQSKKWTFGYKILIIFNFY